jgi:hypothetical protein
VSGALRKAERAGGGGRWEENMVQVGSSSAGRPVRHYAPFLTSRWWLLHTAAIAAVYAVGHWLFGG